MASDHVYREARCIETRHREINLCAQSVPTPKPIKRRKERKITHPIQNNMRYTQDDQLSFVDLRNRDLISLIRDRAVRRAEFRVIGSTIDDRSKVNDGVRAADSVIGARVDAE